MKKDIEMPEVEGVFIAVVQESSKEIPGELIWNVYLINHKDQNLKNVFVSSKGYNNEAKAQKKSSTLRHFFKEVKAKSAIKVEPIIEEVFGLHNEFLLSFYLNDQLYDKKYIFLAESIQSKNFIKVPILNKSGVMIK